MTAEEVLQQLEEKIELDEVGIELWFDTEEYRLWKAGGRSLADFMAKILERS